MAINPVKTVVVTANSVHLSNVQNLDPDGLTISETSMGGRELLNGELFSKLK
jgi:hypothetical protein